MTFLSCTTKQKGGKKKTHLRQSQEYHHSTRAIFGPFGVLVFKSERVEERAP